MTSPTRRPACVTVALALALATVGCGDGHRGSVATPHAPSLASLARKVGLFRRPPRATDALPRGLVPTRLLVVLGLDARQSRLAGMFEGTRLYLVPSPGKTCMFGANEAFGSCWGTRAVEAGLATTTTMCGPGLGAGRVATFGVVPDGVRSVTIVRRNEPSRTVQVRGNVFVGLTSSRPPLPLQITWQADGGQVVHSTGIPPKVAREGC